MVKLSLLFLVLLVTTTYAQIGEDGTGTVNGYSIGPGADLSGADLSFADLSSADLSNANLSGAILDFSDLSGADLSDARLIGANLIDTILIFADLSGADLTGANLLDARLIEANLTNADLSLANLSFADLSFADLPFVNLRGAILSFANLSGASLTRVISGNTNGTPTLPSGYQMINGYIVGPGVDLTNALLTGADLTGANLEGADLSGADLTGADLSNALLSGTIWSNVISQSDYDAVVAERDAALAAQATAEAERDAKLTLDEVKDLRAGSTMIAVENGIATLSMEVEESDDLDLEIWTTGGTASVQMDAEAGKKFYRFKMTE